MSASTTALLTDFAGVAALLKVSRRAELVKAGMISASEEIVAENRSAPIAALLASYVASLRASGAVEKHVQGVQRRLTTLCGQCRFRTLQDVTRDGVEAWLLRPENQQRSARTKNT